MTASDIEIRGAREHNLRDVEVAIPRNQLVCLTGVSGSGKSSLAFDTLFAEGQRRYVESLSTFARQYLGQMPKPDVDFIAGLSPSISISQKTSGQNPRSTVGTITEIYDYLRVLFARVGQGHCPSCSRRITAQSREQIIEQISALPASAKFSVLAPLVRGQKGEHRDLFADLIKQGFLRARVDGEIVSLSDDLRLDRQMRHNIEVVIDRLTGAKSHATRLAEAVELALRMGDGNLIVAPNDEVAGPSMPAAIEAEEGSPTPQRGKNADMTFSAHYACTHCRRSFEPPSPQLFSFNSPRGMCQACDGLGQVYSFDIERLIPDATKSFQQGCFELIGAWRDLGRWRKHIYSGLAETLEYREELEPGTVLETPWDELDSKLQRALLWGTGDLHITFTWKAGGGQHKYGGTWDGIIPELLEKYRGSKSKMQRRQLEAYMRVVRCGECEGQRLNEQARSVRIASAHRKFADASEKSLPEVCNLAVSDAADFFSKVQLDGTRKKIAEDALKEITGRLGFLHGVGLEYLSLDRTAPTLSGGESQRIRLAGQVGCGLVGVTYILDEPSIGLHPRDNTRLLGTLKQLRDLGNTVVVVEHDEDTMRAADHIIDFGPGPGIRGGEVVAKGSPRDIEREDRSLTGGFLSGKQTIAVPETRRSPTDKQLRVVGATHNNLKNIDVALPLGLFVCVTGVSGSGKSSLVNEIIANTLHVELNRGEAEPGACERVEGLEHLDKLIAIDQSPIGRTPRSNPATYIKVFDDIRRLFAQLPEAKTRGYKEGRFSFNVNGGRCEACEGNGSNKLEMDFLADVWVTCPVCEGHRFNRETLQVRYKGKSIADVLEMDVQQALAHFENIPKIKTKLQTLHDVGLDYLKLGQPSPTLSGGEAQRIKLARELVKRSTGQTLYLLDEPTTGLHFADIRMLLSVLHGFVEAGNTVLVVEHQLDVIKTADWVIDLGPEGGASGGRVIAAGPPEEVAQATKSHTGAALAEVLPNISRTNGKPATPKAPKPSKRATNGLATKIKVRGAKQHNLRNVDVEIPRDEMTVCCGPSGSGKTSLAMDTIYAEGQRRYVESLSSYARQFVSQMQKPRLEHIEGLSPAIAIEQKNAGNTPRSTVGTVTEIYDYLRILFSRRGVPYCPDCEQPIGIQTADQIVDKIMAHEEGTRLYLMAPVEIAVGTKYESLWEECRAAGYARVRIDGETHSLDDVPKIDRRRKHRVEIVVDRIIVKQEAMRRIAESVEQALSRGTGLMHVAYPAEGLAEPKWQVVIHSQHFACDDCGRSFEPLAPQHFSFNSSFGWCEACEGLGTQRGANPAALVKDENLTLAEGALAVWSTQHSALGQAMLAAFAQHTGIPTDVPFRDLNARQKRVIFRGLPEDEWIEGPPANGKSSSPAFRFQFKGLYPALEEAANLSTTIRNRLSHLMDEVDCAECGGSRLRDDAAAMRYRNRTIDEYCRMPLGRLVDEVRGWDLDKTDQKVAGELIREVRDRLTFLVDVGLDYLTLHRAAPTLSGGEAQRIRLASQVGSGLTGVLYVLDEPTIGLHPRDNLRLISALKKLRDLGNTLILVEHDREVIAAADQLLDFGPAAGRNGGKIVARGEPEQVAKKKVSLTGNFLSGRKSIPVPTNRRIAPGDSAAEAATAKKKSARTRKRPVKKTAKNQAISTPRERFNWLKIIGARHNNLRDISTALPLAAFTAITGPSGSGKSTLIEEILYKSLSRTLHRATAIPGAHDAIKGLEFVNKVIRVDQQPLGNSPSSNPATYTGAFELIRQLFAQLPDAKIRGYTPRRFSFNVPGGRCESCEGQGQLRIEMHFLPDVWVECDTCRGQRYNAETLAVRYKEHNVSDVLNLEIAKAVELFQNIPKIRRILQTLCDVGLEYLTLGQPAPTLSGGEAQRVKLAAELSRPDTGRTLYLLDEPTTGLHFDDLRKLLDVLNRLVDLGNTVVVIEHNLDVIKNADWVIDLGPEAGNSGGQIVFAGTPEELVAHAALASEPQNGKRATKKSATKKRPTKKTAAKKKAQPAGNLLRSHTGEALAPVLTAGPHEPRIAHDFAAEASKLSDGLDITAVGQGVKMPWEEDGRRWHTVDRVGRKGEPCKWEGEALAAVIDRIYELGEFSETDWSQRTVVEIAAEKKSDGWFFHAITGEPWLVKLKFRVASRTFKREELLNRLALTPLDDMPDLPVYGGEPRVKCKNLRGPWQEVQLAVHTLAEIDHDEFWAFLKEAVESFEKATNRFNESPEVVMPWKKLGQKWHFNRRGFPPGKKVQWSMDTLQDLYDLLVDTAAEGQFLWNNQQVVHLFVPEQKEPWATLHTKRVDSLHLTLTGPKDRFAMGRIAKLGAGREFKADLADVDQVKIKFRNPDDVHSKALEDFLQEHLQTVIESQAAK